MSICPECKESEVDLVILPTSCGSKGKRMCCQPCKTRILSRRKDAKKSLAKTLSSITIERNPADKAQRP